MTTYLPFLACLYHYRQADLAGELLAGVIVTIMLAGLPPHHGGEKSRGEL